MSRLGDVMRINRSLLNWGVFLIALGGVPLAVQQGFADESIAGDLWRLWPLILVGIGLGLIMRWTPLAWVGGALVAGTFGLIFGALIAGGFSGISNTCIGAGNAETVTTQDGDVASSTEFAVDVELSCGTLTLGRASGSSWDVVAVHDVAELPTIEGSETELRLRQAEGDNGFFALSQQVRDEWQVEVPSGAVLSLNATLNAAEGTFDLGAGPVTAVGATFNAADATIDMGSATTPTPARTDLTLNASSLALDLPSGSLTGNITLNASSLDLCIPQSAETRIRVDATLASDDLEASGLIREGDGWQSAGYTTASTRIDLDITSTISSISVERPEVCS